ncbi:PE-PGRS family protein, partial [Mycobacterium kansasii]
GRGGSAALIGDGGNGGNAGAGPTPGSPGGGGTGGLLVGADGLNGLP